MRRLQGSALALVAILGAVACRPREGGIAQERPPTTPPAPVVPGAFAAGDDVVLITIDTLRADSVGFAGNSRVATPVLDRLAAGGRVFFDAHAHNVVTLPSHTNILTGLYPYQHGVRDNTGFRLPPTVPTLATILKQAGYATGAFVGAFPLDASFGLGRSFDVYDDKYPRGSHPEEFVLAERRGDQVVAAARRWWDGRRGHRRFLWVHLYDPHAAYEPPEPFASRYRENPYLGEIAATDSFLAPLLDPFLAGKEPPALIVLTADHGESLGEHGELTHGLFAYEATLKVPLVVWGPGISAARDGRAARHVDVVPTVLQALGLKAPADLPGRSLLGPPEPQADSYFESLSTSLNRGWAPLRGLLRDHRKLIDLPLPELYALDDDPQEQKNLFQEERREARELAAALPPASRWPPANGAGSPRAAVTAEEMARMRSLGYAVGSAPAKIVYTAGDDPKTLLPLDEKLHQVVDAYSRGRYEDAARLAREVIAARPQMSESYEHLALALRQLDRQEEAIEVLQGAVRTLGRGAVPESLVRQLGLAQSEARHPEAAVATLEPLAGSADPQTLNALGIALSDAGRHPEAAALLTRVTTLHPEDPKGFENLGIVELRLGRKSEARGHLGHALELNPELPISWNTLGVALYQLGKPAEALDAWERAVALDGKQVDALYNIGLVAAEAGRGPQAKTALERFVATAPPGRWSAEIENARQLLARL